MRKPTIYLAGAIRDHHPEDVKWRERTIDVLQGHATILNPLSRKTFNPHDEMWEMSRIPATAAHIVKQDLWCIDRADIVVANLLSLSEGYPSIGTMMELGRATATNSLIYAVVSPGYNGSKNPGVFKVHPFLEQLIAQAFPSVEDMLEFLGEHINMLNGETPRWGGYVPTAHTVQIGEAYEPAGV